MPSPSILNFSLKRLTHTIAWCSLLLINNYLLNSSLAKLIPKYLQIDFIYLLSINIGFLTFHNWILILVSRSTRRLSPNFTSLFLTLPFQNRDSAYSCFQPLVAAKKPNPLEVDYSTGISISLQIRGLKDSVVAALYCYTRAEKEYEHTPDMGRNIRTCLEILLEALFFTSDLSGCTTLVSKYHILLTLLRALSTTNHNQ